VRRSTYLNVTIPSARDNFKSRQNPADHHDSHPIGPQITSKCKLPGTRAVPTQPCQVNRRAERGADLSATGVALHAVEFHQSDNAVIRDLLEALSLAERVILVGDDASGCSEG
jgi:hypothetical protein